MLPSTPKLHRKLKHSKEVTVTLESLVELLSSAYGIQELDSKIILDKNNIDWKNLSVANLEEVVVSKVEDGVDHKKADLERVSVSTSTSSLKKNRGSKTNIDMTLVSIKSLENFTQSSKRFEDQHVKAIAQLQAVEDCKESSEDVKKKHLVGEHKDQKPSNEVCADTNTNEQQVVCGFFVDDLNKKIIFDIQFTNKIKTIQLIPDFNISETEISINIIDIPTHTKSCVTLTKSSLVSKFNYFAEVDNEYGLENLDVTIECNHNVFQWIVQWVKADVVMCKPNLNVSNVKHILSMAYNLGADDLLDECLVFFHSNFGNILKHDNDIEYIFDDVLIDKYVRLVTNSEVDEISDEYISFKTKLFCSLIVLLVDPYPLTKVGHFSSLATIFQCTNCEKFLSHDTVDYIACRSDCMQMNYKGELIPFHELSPSWDLSRYIELMFDDLGNWRLVYWRLWGMCHFLTCVECHLPYPINQSDWCVYHTSDIEYFLLNSKVFYPIGMYQCCGEKAFRFNTIEPYGGCKSRSHTPKLNSEESVHIFEIFQKYKSFISTNFESFTNVPKRFVKLLKHSGVPCIGNKLHVNSFWWLGIRLAPKEKKDYSIIPQKVLNHLKNRRPHIEVLKIYKPLTFKVQVHFGLMPSCTILNKDVENSVSESEFFNLKKNSKLATRKVKTNVTTLSGMKMKKKKSMCYQPTETLWSNNENNKDNQDNQRDFEEIAMRNLANSLIPDYQGFVGDPVGGSYLRLEAQWKQEHGKDSKTGKSIGTVVNRTFPLSWYRRLSL